MITNIYIGSEEDDYSCYSYGLGEFVFLVFQVNIDHEDRGIFEKIFEKTKIPSCA